MVTVPEPVKVYPLSQDDPMARVKLKSEQQKCIASGVKTRYFKDLSTTMREASQFINEEDVTNRCFAGKGSEAMLG